MLCAAHVKSQTSVTGPSMPLLRKWCQPGGQTVTGPSMPSLQKLCQPGGQLSTANRRQEHHQNRKQAWYFALPSDNDGNMSETEAGAEQVQTVLSPQKHTVVGLHIDTTNIV
jgi:hypothetical protein